jgi:hypothetical protein
MTPESSIVNENIECPLCLGEGNLKRTEVLDRLGVKDFARVAQLSAEEAFRLLNKKSLFRHCTPATNLDLLILIRFDGVESQDTPIQAKGVSLAGWRRVNPAKRASGIWRAGFSGSSRLKYLMCIRGCGVSSYTGIAATTA